MNQMALNKELNNELKKKKINKKKIVELLNMGANPLGNYSKRPPMWVPFIDAIFSDNAEEITKLLLDNGMIIDSSNYEYDLLDPLFWLGCRADIVGIKILELLLDYNTPVNSIEHFVWNVYEFVNDCYVHPSDDHKLSKSELTADMKMVMLCASYDYVINNSDFVQDIISYDRNNKDNLKKFANYNSLYLEATPAELHFYDKKSHELIWTIYTR